MQPTLKRYFALLVTYLKPQWRRTCLMALCILLGTSLQLLNPQILRYFLDTANKHGSAASLLFASVFFIAIAIVNQAVSMATAYLTNYVAWTATNQLRSDLVTHCLSLDLTFHKTRTIGELIERIDGDVDALSNFFSQWLINLLTSVLLLAGVLILLFTINWRIGATMVLFSLMAFVVLLRLRRRALPYSLALRQMSATFYGFLSEQLGGMEDIRANGAVPYILRRFYLLLRQWVPINRKAQLTGSDIGTATFFLLSCGTAIALLLAAYMWYTHTITIGAAYLIFAYTQLLAQPITQLQIELQDLQQVGACVQRIEELLTTTPLLQNEHDAPLPQGALSVTFHNVTFGYVTSSPVLHHFNVQIQPGRVLGVLGRTGSGKTTLARLLVRLYDPQDGEIRVGDVSIQTTSLHTLRQHIGMVTQDVQLFHATIRDNLTFFDHTISTARILTAIEQMGLSSWYQTLAQGLDTIVKPGGTSLSAGEGQLLAFTRVFLSHPGLVILDEASSRLDPTSEALIEHAVDTLFSERTGLVIAHRLATVQRADDILIIEDGRVLEYGAREVLAADPTSHFSRLLQTGLEEVRI